MIDLVRVKAWEAELVDFEEDLTPLILETFFLSFLVEDLEIRVEKIQISLEDAIKGNTRKIDYKRRTTCKTCNGHGGSTKTCETCNGNGKVRERVQTVFGIMEQTRTCSSCAGHGEKILEKCSTCHGKKYEDISTKKDIDIPAGIENGMSIKMRSE